MSLLYFEARSLNPDIELARMYVSHCELDS